MQKITEAAVARTAYWPEWAPFPDYFPSTSKSSGLSPPTSPRGHETHPAPGMSCSPVGEVERKVISKSWQRSTAGWVGALTCQAKYRVVLIFKEQLSFCKDQSRENKVHLEVKQQQGVQMPVAKHCLSRLGGEWLCLGGEGHTEAATPHVLEESCWGSLGS